MATGDSFQATHRFARISALKARPTVDLIRGQRADAALEQLRFSNTRAAKYIRNVLKSAMANANEKEADVSRLYVALAKVDGGPMYKRWKAKDRGRSHPILRRTSHIVIGVMER